MKRLALAFAALLAIAASAEPPRLTVSTDWLQAHAGDRGVTVVEIGDRVSFEKEHIPSARFVALSDIAVTRNGVPSELPEVGRLEKALGAAGVPDRGRIVLYARDPIHAARGFFTLDYLGCTSDAVLLDGGFAKWSAEKRPVESGAPAAKATTFVARSHPKSVVDLAAMRKLVELARENPEAMAIVDARPPAQFDGSEPGADVKRPGRIPTAINIPWNENLTGGATPLFRDAGDLRELYRRAGVSGRATVVVYCRTGMQAAVDYFVLRSLGREVSLYDGSYIEWSAAEASGM